MMSNQDPLQELFSKFLQDQTMTAAEIRQLRACIQDEQQQAKLDALLAALYEENMPVGQTTESNTRIAFEEVWTRLQQDEPETETGHPARQFPLPVAVPLLQPRRHWWKYAAAAILLLTAGAGVYWYQSKTARPVQAPALAGNTSIQPGRDKAVLTLADGSVIVLDEAATGTLTDQGNARLVKRSNGQLAYEVANDQPNTTPLYNTITTPRGGKFHLTLPDGTQVWLNAASSLHYPTVFTGASREVTLTGEAYFEVAKNAAMPFRVLADKMQVEVLGTHFNVMAYADEGSINTTLLEGKVKVIPTQQAGELSAVLAPAQQAQLVRSNGVLEIRKEVNTEEVIAWKNDLVMFAGKDVRTAMRMIARWYDVEVEYKGNIPDVHFRGEIASNVPITQVLEMMEQTGEVHFDVIGKKIRVTP